MVRLAESNLFRKLPAASVRVLLEQIDKISVSKGEQIIRQGDPGDYYYIVDSGTCLVTRKENPLTPPVTLAELGPGEAFGEEEMVTGSTRNANVTMSSDGELLRLKAETFADVVRDALVDKVPHKMAERMRGDGAVWVDVRDKVDFDNTAHFEPAINLPLSSLRETCHKALPKDKSLLVCANEESVASVATLLLVQRGFDAVCLAEPVSQVAILPERVSPKVDPTAVANESVVAEVREREQQLNSLESSEPIPRDLYDDTYVGQSLADLIDQMHHRHHEILTTPESDLGGDPGASQAVDLELFADEVERSLQPEPGEADSVSLEEHEPPSTDAVGQYLQGLGILIREQIERELADERRQMREEIDRQVASIKSAAVEEIKRQTLEFKSQLKEDYLRKHNNLKSQYQKLMGLAHRVSRQKAELKRARQELEGKLQATTRLQGELDTLRTTLSQSIGNFDTLDDDDSPSS